MDGFAVLSLVWGEALPVAPAGAAVGDATGRPFASALRNGSPAAMLPAGALADGSCAGAAWVESLEGADAGSEVG